MAYQSQYSIQSQPQLQQDVVSGEQYRYALTNFRIAHEKVEQQRAQLEEQERQVAQLRARIALLEGGSAPAIVGKNGNTVDDFYIKSSASQLDKLINRWAAEVVNNPPAPLPTIANSLVRDILGGGSELQIGDILGTPMQVQCLLRHALSETISEGIINCLIVTSSSEANIQLTRIHEHIFLRDPTVASVWRRQTYSAAVDSCTPEMYQTILSEHMPSLYKFMAGNLPITSGSSILETAFEFSRVLHGSTTNNSSDAFYRAFVPELGSKLHPTQIELVKRCQRSEQGDVDRVGATIFPGLVKVTNLAEGPNQEGRINQNVVRRAQVICECAMNAA